MTKDDFHVIVGRIIEELKSEAKATPEIICSCKSGDDFEICVVNAIKQVLNNNTFELIIHHTPKSHVFPDIILETKDGQKFGIEVKSSSAMKSSGWKINGNSVMGSTRDNDVIETFIIFGKTSRGILDFKARKYEECVANVVVTHSPRYLIDMELPLGETFFDKSNISYSDITTSDNPIFLITKYFQEKGEKAWWLSDSTPAALRMFSDLLSEEQNECLGYGFAHFPELFERNGNKYRRFALWLASERSVVSPSLRDDFSAGGRVDVLINKHYYSQLPQIYKNLMDYRPYLIKALNDSDVDTLANDWNTTKDVIDGFDSITDAWISVFSSHICTAQFGEDIEPQILLQNIMNNK